MNIAEELTPENSCLVLVDYQTKLFDVVPEDRRKTVMNNAIALSKLGAAFDLPTIILGNESEQNGVFVPEIVNRHKNAPRIPRTTFSAFKTKEIADAIKTTGRKNLIFGGIATDVCVTITALDALREGYGAYVVTDASGTTDFLAEVTAINRLAQAGAVTTTWVALGGELISDWASQYASKLGQIFAEHLGGDYAQHT